MFILYAGVKGRYFGVIKCAKFQVARMKSVRVAELVLYLRPAQLAFLASAQIHPPDFTPKFIQPAVQNTLNAW